jgi:hypothetical protein
MKEYNENELTDAEYEEILSDIQSGKPYEPLPSVQEMEVLIANRREVCR